ncbi:type II toxin-antitoxin system RelE/ParE family toxin [Nocardioides sp. LHD-245]|uniref:type II toxin-antitoxin system RelE/ParE family toxin n=1 Tax=Nocardioides sp. LHD-245 TaxID=3051387 RepID=UPI0027E0E50B|nr:type II toxin-antitoxin system RelE/ParE family toxin [Nocardioides sp. LHD-245]
MTYTVQVRPAAERDIERAEDWYAIEAPDHVELFEKELDHAINRAVTHPLLPPALVAGARRVHLAIYPYEIWYLVHEHLRIIEVAALVHDRQNLDSVVARL